MKQIIIILITISLFISCKEESGPTVFEGKVVYADDGRPFVDGVAQATSERYSFGSAGLELLEVFLDDKGMFKLEFKENNEIDYLTFGITLLKDTVINNIETKVVDLSYTIECSPYDCDNEFKPGKAYRDMVISISK